MYHPKDDLHISYEYCGPGILGYTTPSTRRIYVDSFKVTSYEDKLRVEEHERQHNRNPDDSEYMTRLKTDLALINKGISTRPACCFAS